MDEELWGKDSMSTSQLIRCAEEVEATNRNQIDENLWDDDICPMELVRCAKEVETMSYFADEADDELISSAAEVSLILAGESDDDSEFRESENNINVTASGTWTPQKNLRNAVDSPNTPIIVGRRPSHKRRASQTEDRAKSCHLEDLVDKSVSSTSKEVLPIGKAVPTNNKTEPSIDNSVHSAGNVVKPVSEEGALDGISGHLVDNAVCTVGKAVSSAGKGVYSADKTGTGVLSTQSVIKFRNILPKGVVKTSKEHIPIGRCGDNQQSQVHIDVTIVYTITRFYPKYHNRRGFELNLTFSPPGNNVNSIIWLEKLYDELQRFLIIKCTLLVSVIARSSNFGDGPVCMPFKLMSDFTSDDILEIVKIGLNTQNLSTIRIWNFSMTIFIIPYEHFNSSLNSSWKNFGTGIEPSKPYAPSIKLRDILNAYRNNRNNTINVRTKENNVSKRVFCKLCRIECSFDHSCFLE